MRRVLIYWLILVLATILGLVAGGVYWLVYSRVDEATLKMMQDQLRRSWLGDERDMGFREGRQGPEHRPGEQPPPQFRGPQHPPQSRNFRGGHPPMHGGGPWSIFPWEPPAPREAVHLVITPGVEQNWDELCHFFSIVRYYDLNGHCLLERGGDALPATPPTCESEVQAMLAKGETSRLHSVHSDYERWLLWDNLVTDPEGKPVGVVEIGKGSKPIDELLRTLGVALALAGLGGLILGGILAGPLARRLSRPIEDMAEAARLVSQGDLRVRVVPQGTVEVKTMARDFNYMVEQLSSILETQKRFVADASHELKTPLTTVATMAELLHDQEEDLSPERRLRALALIEAEVQRMSRLVGDLLVLSRLEQAPPRLEEVDLAASLEEIVSTYQASHSNLDLKVPSGGETVDTLCRLDPGGWSRAVRNLLDNALAHTPAPGRVQVRLSQQSPFLLLEVADQGTGIPAADLPKITQRFYRSDQSRSRGTGGTGLGLAIVAAWVERNGGRLQIQSIVGEGTVASIWLPNKK